VDARRGYRRNQMCNLGEIALAYLSDSPRFGGIFIFHV
jgi:hypothetical protein